MCDQDFLLTKLCCPINRIYRKYRKKASLRKGLKHQDGTPLPMLSRQQKNEIDFWYEKFGLILNDYYYHRWYYEVTGCFSASCVPESVMTSQIIWRLNDLRLCRAWADKAYYDMRFVSKCIDMPYTVLRNINGIFYDNSYNKIDFHHAERLLEREENVIAKPTIDSGKGSNVKIYNTAEGEKYPLLILRDYSSNYIVQKVIEQHDILAGFNPDSVNTFRIMSLFNGEKVSILASILRVGAPGSHVDNISAGGFAFCIKKDGYLTGPGRNSSGRIVKGTDNIAADRNLLACYYGKIIKSIKELHPQLPYFRIIAWDITIDKKGTPILIEYNIEQPGLHVIQALCGTFLEPLCEEFFQKKTMI